MSDKICLPTEHLFLLLIIFLLMTMFYVYNNMRIGQVDNFNLSVLSEKMKTIDETPLLQDLKKLIINSQKASPSKQNNNSTNIASRYPPPDKTIIKSAKNNKMLSKEAAIKILTTSNNISDRQIVLDSHPELVLDTQPRSLVINNPNESLVDSYNEVILVNDADDIENDSLELSSPLQSRLANPDLEKRYALETRDVEAVFNDFRAPERRDPEYAYPTNDVKNIINIPTRGSPDNYHSVGVVVRKTDEKVFQLFGRQKFPGSSQWEYYVSGADNYGYPNKMPLVSKGNRELSDKDRIELPWLDKKNGDFEVNLYNFDVPRYNPYDL